MSAKNPPDYEQHEQQNPPPTPPILPPPTTPRNKWSIQHLQPTPWTTLPNTLTSERTYCSAVSTSNRIFIMGGSVDFNETNCLESVEMYDTTNHMVCRLPPMNQKRWGCGAVILGKDDNKRIVVMGGFYGGKILDTVEYFDLGYCKEEEEDDDDDGGGKEGGEWVMMKERMNVGRCNFAIVVDHHEDEENIYVVGGYNKAHGGDLCTMDRWNTKTNRWTTMPSMRTKRWCPSAVVVGRKIYVMGGKFSKTMEAFDITSGRWESNDDGDDDDLLPPMTTERSGSSAVCMDEKSFLVIGGETCKTAEAFHVEERRWISMPEMSVERACGAAVRVGSCVYIVGGRDEDKNVYDTIEKMELGFLMKVPPFPKLPLGPTELVPKKRIKALEAYTEDLGEVREGYMKDIQDLKLRNRQKCQRDVDKLRRQIEARHQKHRDEEEEIDRTVASWVIDVDEQLKEAKLQLHSLRLRETVLNKTKKNNNNTTNKPPPLSPEYALVHDIPNELLCPITLELMRDPVLAADGFTYERSAIQQVLDGATGAGANNNNDKKKEVVVRSPQTNEPLAHRFLIPNHAIASMCQNFCVS